jgi:hypothetical protein
MKYTGFGNVDGYSAMYCLDNTFEVSAYKNIPWPCRNMAIEFGTTKQWILSLGREAPNDIEVTVTNYITGEKKKYSQATPSEFYISNVNYGLNGCIIFHGPYNNKDGDSYRVDVKGTGVAVSYDVNFFSVICKHEKELLEIIEPSCLKNGKKYLYCKLCDCKEEEEIKMKPHKEKILYESKPSCTQKGYKKLICEFCFETIEKEVDMIPHNYKYSKLKDGSNRYKGICRDCKKEIIQSETPPSYSESDVYYEGEEWEVEEEEESVSEKEY